MLPVTRNAATEMDVGKDGDARLVQEALAQLLRVGASTSLARLGYVRPRVERSTRCLAAEAGQSIEKSDDQVTALEKRRAHGVCRILGAVDRLHRGPLADL